MDCRVCHVGAAGGPLTPAGRDYLWSGSGASLLLAGQDRASEAEHGALGEWGGDLTVWTMAGRERAAGSHEHFYSVSESLRLQGERLFGGEEWSFRGEGFARSVEQSGSGGSLGDVVEWVGAELDYRAADGTTVARLGRQWITQGVGAHRLDGLSLHRQMGASFEADVYGGVPSDNALGGASGDLLVGGRVGWRGARSLKLGASGFYQKDDTDPADLKAGLDLFWSPSSTLDLTGFLFYDWIADEWYDARLHLGWRPSLRWQWSLDWTHTIPGLFLPKNSIFSVFSLDRYDEGSLTLTRRMTEHWSWYAFGRSTWYEDSSRAVRTGGGLSLTYGPGGEDAVGAEVGHQDEDRHAGGGERVDGDALFTRAYHRLYWTARVYTAEDLMFNFYAGDPYERDSTVARLFVGYEAAGYDVQVGTQYFRTPEFESRIDFLARLTWRF